MILFARRSRQRCFRRRPPAHFDAQREGRSRPPRQKCLSVAASGGDEPIARRRGRGPRISNWAIVANWRLIGCDPAMGTQPQTPTSRMTVEEYLAWAEGRPGRYELIGGEVVARAAERAAHWKVKLATHVALLTAIKAKALPCHVVPDGATVRIDATTAYEPDAMVYRGQEAPPRLCSSKIRWSLSRFFRPRRDGKIKGASSRITSACPASRII